MAEGKRKTLRQLEKEAGPLIPEKDDPENKFLSKAQFIAKQEKKKARKIAMNKAAAEFDKEQAELDAKKVKAQDTKAKKVK